MGGIRGMATFGNCVGFLCWLSCSFHSLLRPTWSVNLPWITKRLLAFLWEKEWPQARKQVYGVSLLFRLHINFFMGKEVGEATGYGNNIKNDIIITTISAYLVSHINVHLIKFVRNTVRFYAGEIWGLNRFGHLPKVIPSGRVRIKKSGLASLQACELSCLVWLPITEQNINQ